MYFDVLLLSFVSFVTMCQFYLQNLALVELTNTYVSTTTKTNEGTMVNYLNFVM